MNGWLRRLLVWLLLILITIVGYVVLTPVVAILPTIAATAPIFQGLNPWLALVLVVPASVLLPVSLLIQKKLAQKLAELSREDISSQIPSKHCAALLKSIERVWNTDFFQENPAWRVYYPAGIFPLELRLQEGRLEELLLQNPPDSTDTHRDSTKITEIYEKTKGDGLLILGGPGSGKTTLLLDLAKDLLESRSNNE